MRKRLFGKLTIFVLLLTVSLFLIPAFGATKNDINNSKARINSNQEKLKEIKEEKQQLKKQLEELNGLKSDTAAYIAGLDRKQEELSTGIADLQISIAGLEEEIRILEEELQEAQNEAEEQKEGMGVRIRYMYETDRAGTLARIFESGSLSDILNQAEYFRQVTEFDRKKLEEYRQAVEVCKQKQEELDSELAVMDAQKENLQEQLAASEQLENEKAAELRAYEEKISSVNAESTALSKDENKLQEAIKAEEKKIAEIEAELKRQEEEARKKANSASLKSIGDLKFLWPVPSSSRVTSTFGQREAPVAGASTTHKGIDIGASSGSKILASESGTVVIATYSESAGNYVMISHGNGIYTVYMHLKEIKVSLNQNVKRGDQIGTVGNTGYSTGPHLHFGIRVNGEYKNPQNYVSP